MDKALFVIQPLISWSKLEQPKNMPVKYLIFDTSQLAKSPSNDVQSLNISVNALAVEKSGASRATSFKLEQPLNALFWFAQT